MGQKQTEVINARLSTLNPNERLFKINAGMGWTGKIIKKTTKIIILENPFPLHAAPEGWPDLCGWEEVEITPDMVGQKIARFVGEEIKVTGSLSKKQKSFGKLITAMGGVFRVIR
jgi:hypothetical protein